MPGARVIPSQEVSSEFVRQYYRVLQDQPQDLHHFYNKTMSVYTEHYPGAPVQYVQGSTEIGQHILQRRKEYGVLHGVDIKDIRCEIEDIQWIHQVSVEESLVVAVTGSQLLIAAGVPTKFRIFQTFVLACERDQTNHYCIINNVCFFQRDQPMQLVSAPQGVQIPNGETLAPSPHSQGLVPVSPPTNNKSMKIEVVEVPKSPDKEGSGSGSPKFGTVPVPEDQPSTLDLPEPSIQPAPVVEPEAPVEEDGEEEEVAEEEVAEPAEEKTEEEPEQATPKAPPATMSWAARAAQAAAKPEPVKPAPPKPRKPATTAANNSTTAPNAEPETKEAKDTTAGEETTPAPRKERAPYKQQDAADLEASVFVSGVPQTCGEERLKELFGKHGEVTKVSLKAEKHFAIIDFESAEAAADALKQTGLRCDGSIMKVEPRRGKGVKPSRGKGESRGQGEKGRGRGKDGGSRGGGRRAPRDAQ